MNFKIVSFFPSDPREERPQRSLPLQVHRVPWLRAGIRKRGGSQAAPQSAPAATEAAATAATAAANGGSSPPRLLPTQDTKLLIGF